MDCRMKPLLGGACVLATVTALLANCVALKIESFTEEAVVYAGDTGHFFDVVSLECLITDPPEDVQTGWMYGAYVYPNSSLSARHEVTVVNVSGTQDRVLVLDISNLSSADNGTYVCRARAPNDTTWMYDSLELVLIVHLKPEPNDTVTIYNDASEVELACEMYGYAPPNFFLKWYRGDTELSNDSSKYTVLYRDNLDSPYVIQRGSGEENSVLGVLVISDPIEEDSGFYYCRLQGYNLEAQVELQVLGTGTPDNIGVVGEQENMPTDSGDSTSNQMITIIIAAVAGFLGLIVIVLLVVIIVVACQRCRRGAIVIESSGATLTELPLVKPSEDTMEDEPPPPIPPRTNSQSSSKYMTSSQQHNEVPDLIRSYNNTHQPALLPPKPEPQIQPTFPYYDKTDDTRKVVPPPEYPGQPEPKKVSGKKKTYYDQVLLKTESGTNSLPGASGFSLASVPSPHDVLSGSLQRQQDFTPYPVCKDGFTPDDLVPYDSVDNDYDQIYSEPIEPAMLHGSSSEEHMNQEAVPYSAIYDDPRPLAQSEAPLEVTNDNIIEIRKLGTGQFGNVILARTKNLSLMDLQLSETNSDRNYSILVAVKKLKTNAESGLYEAFEKEVKFMSRLNHDNVVRLLGVNWKDECFIMMEYMENGDLNQFLQKLTLVPDTVVGLREMEITPVILLYLGVQIASGMHYLASRRFVHRDLATRNCLVGKDFVVKISDFGMSRRLYESAYYRVQGTLVLPIRWMACETFYGKFSVKSDSWAFGVTLWELYTLASCDPYEDMSDEEVIQDAIRGPSRKLLPRPGACPKDVYAVMLRCWVSDPAMRADFGEIYSRLYMTYTSQAL